MAQTSYSGGEVRASRAVTGSAVWNADPLPKRPPRTYQLTVQRGDGAKLKAVANSVEDLIAFEQQTRALDYEWVNLERQSDE
jgi:hypothetical protein